MVQSAEGEPPTELDRFCDALIAIRAEIAKVESGAWPCWTNWRACWPAPRLRVRWLPSAC